ncbi:MAG: sensor histidine kinase [Kangiellaceae bacterium]|nr:sensor histidine kinase [Kangiellaceae bacterium]
MPIKLLPKHSEHLGYSLFWLLVFLLNIGPQWDNYSGIREVLETASTLTALQVLVVAIALKVLLPVFLNRDKRLLFLVSLVAVTFVAGEINILIRYLYLEPTYAVSYKRFIELYGHMTLSDRMFSLWTMKWMFFSKIPQLLYPAAILIAHSLYKKQQKLLLLSEQKKKAELEALKSQLNPHFIFNTLNNLYALTLKKSDKAPIVIEKLSDILDYVIYRCNDDFVPLSSEIQLLESYITLEKIRYGQRIAIEFSSHIESSCYIAPLILLTLVENACKHSSGEEINQATVNIELIVQENQLRFTVINSKPKNLYQEANSSSKREGIGLSNMTRQLDLIYGDNYTLDVTDSPESYQTRLSISL